MATAYEHLSQKIEATIAKYKAPAIMAAVVRNGGDYTLASVRGVRKIDVSANDANNKIQASDTFCLGSVSKPVSGYMLAYIVQQMTGAFNWNTKIRDVFTELDNPVCQKHFNIYTNYLDATIAKMMTHTAYFPWAPTNSMDYNLDTANLKKSINANYQAEYCNYTSLMQRRYNYLIAAQQDMPVTAYTYNGGPIIPVTMAERITGKVYEQMIQEYVFQPLGMTTAAVGRMATSSIPNGTWGHTYDSTHKKFVPDANTVAPTFDYHSHAPAGSVHFGYEDAIKFITALFLKNGKTKTVVQLPMLANILKHNANGFSLSGWIAGGSGDDVFVSHDGDDGNCHCRITVYNNRGDGYIVSCNGSGWDGTYDSNGNPNSIGGFIVNEVAVEIENMLNNWKTNF